MYNLKINVTDLLSSKKKNKNEMWFLCVFWLLLQKIVCSRLKPLIMIHEELSGMSTEKKDWILKEKESLIDVCAHAWQAAI